MEFEPLLNILFLLGKNMEKLRRVVSDPAAKLKCLGMLFIVLDKSKKGFLSWILLEWKKAGSNICYYIYIQYIYYIYIYILYI